MSARLSDDEREIFLGILELAAAAGADGDVAGFGIGVGPTSTVGLTNSSELAQIGCQTMVGRHLFAVQVSTQVLNVVNSSSK